jgi:hypothetical protein
MVFSAGPEAASVEQRMLTTPIDELHGLEVALGEGRAIGLDHRSAAEPAASHLIHVRP